jgi:predicted nucleic acid-binding protein
VNILVDTNVLLDVLARREPFFTDSAKVWTLAETGQVTGFVSALSLPNLFYLIRRMQGPREARKALIGLRDIFSLVPLDVQITHQAIDAGISDFEDAIQFFSAIRADSAVLITRNPKHFPKDKVVVQTPGEFLAAHFSA